MENTVLILGKAHSSIRTHTLQEPAYDFSSDAWSFAASRKVGSENTLKAAYETSNKVLDLEWTKESKETGSFKVNTYVCCSFHK